MGKIKPQPIRGDYRARLLDMFSKSLAQFGVKQMRSRVVAHDVHASIPVDARYSNFAHPRTARRHLPDLNNQSWNRLPRVAYLDRPAQWLIVIRTPLDETR